jgi:hypothetical protein
MVALGCKMILSDTVDRNITIAIAKDIIQRPIIIL